MILSFQTSKPDCLKGNPATLRTAAQGEASDELLMEKDSPIKPGVGPGGSRVDHELRGHGQHVGAQRNPVGGRDGRGVIDSVSVTNLATEGNDREEVDVHESECHVGAIK